MSSFKVIMSPFGLIQRKCSIDLEDTADNYGQLFEGFVVRGLRPKRDENKLPGDVKTRGISLKCSWQRASVLGCAREVG